MELFNNIRSFYNNRNSDNWNFAKHYIPDFFDTKFIVHWVYGIIENFPFDKYPMKNETFEEMNIRVKIEKEFNVLLKKDELYEPISIKNLANKFNVEYSQKTVELIPENPGIHYLDDLSISKLKESLKRLSQNSNLNLLIFENEEYDYYTADLQKEYTNITLEKYFEIQELYSFQLDTCLFDNNLNWCLTTAENAPILLGCKKEFELEIEQKINLELFKVENEQEMY
ncbi:hypothetical protein H0I31_00880 [Tenacibaculum sp. AHE15PA]|uniref:hypothetical protein n=1 Tax=unclassified Tenacibaculum TaxID=2635139 RepID=UPI001C4E47E3|nr:MULTISPECIES: hypothetical protein [unclassified Tenacibaculum]QXP74701.1 hypothetical protein H0I30_06140 [Tenacibaculum sp. AHE14PA]QXP76212.1 hypothetical protein H0I31_00880 [Tenacibaculum sp. AHE15PA]